VIELEHGIWRAKNPGQARRQQQFMDDLFATVPAHPLTFEIARRAGRVDGETKRNGIVIPFVELIIGVTALQFDYAVATVNVRHFEMIPNLVVRSSKQHPRGSQQSLNSIPPASYNFHPAPPPAHNSSATLPAKSPLLTCQRGGSRGVEAYPGSSAQRCE
jgi:predicted nucleic acid-binding protein